MLKTFALLPDVLKKNMTEMFKSNRIFSSIRNETGLGIDETTRVVKEVMRRLIKANLVFVTAPEIRETACAVLLEFGHEKERFLYTRLGLPFYDTKEVLELNIEDNEKKNIIYKQIKYEFDSINAIIDSLEELKNG